MNLLQIEYFFMLAEVKSFRKTAEHFYVSQPAVSKQISLLEQEWGFPLFERKYRSVELTSSGVLMLEMRKKAKEDFQSSLYEAKLQSKKYASEICIGVPEYWHHTRLSEVLMDFQKAYPDIALVVKMVPMSYLKVTSPKSDFDLIINYDRNVCNQSELRMKKIGEGVHKAIISPEYPLVKDKKRLKLEDLKKVRVYVPAPDHNLEMTIGYCVFICNNHGFTPYDIKTLPNVESVICAVKMKFGYAILDSLMDLPSEVDLIQIPTNVHFDIMLAWHRENKNPVITRLVEWLTEHDIFT